jgi:hypothetical protein
VFGYKDKNMSNYRETTAESTFWRRAYQVVINNPLEEIPKDILFFEEDVVSVDSTVITNKAGFIRTNYDKTAFINLRDPETGEPTGNLIPQSQVYQALYTMYIDAAIARDIKAATPPEPEAPREPGALT